MYLDPKELAISLIANVPALQKLSLKKKAKAGADITFHIAFYLNKVVREYEENKKIITPKSNIIIPKGSKI
jgi:hypothetical protein